MEYAIKEIARVIGAKTNQLLADHGDIELLPVVGGQLL